MPSEPINGIEAAGRCCCAGCIGVGPCDLDPVSSEDDDGQHCDHHEHDDRCGGYYEDCDDAADDYCVCCECCCTCLGCEYGPRDGMLLTEAQRAVIEVPMPVVDADA